MRLDRNKPVPLYEQLKLILQDKILLRELPSGSLLPTEKELCEQYQISRITSRKALEQLAQSGLIKRVQGKGSIVTDRKPSRSKFQIKGYTKTMEEQGLSGGGKLLHKELIDSTPDLLRLFELPPDASQKFWFFRRLRFTDGTPTVVMNIYVKEELGERMLSYDLASSSFYGIYNELTNSVIVDNKALISATSATPDIAEILETKVGSPLIWYRGVSFLEGGFPIEVNYSLFRAEYFHFETTFYRASVEEVETGLLHENLKADMEKVKGDFY